MKPNIGSNYHPKPTQNRDPTGRFQRIEDYDKFAFSLLDYLIVMLVIIAAGLVLWWFK